MAVALHSDRKEEIKNIQTVAVNDRNKFIAKNINFTLNT